ncbi:pentatricopeptide repeat-containing protein At2g13600-like [Vicia villosa]|uniref:pentatricopeptide repeat-containing protein At2g13600-like n=1 Tax=Vicia villosa TaxID=3911 RepID=UPI00273AD1EE|nr:pentatricopeptide repeat-containing protein At2g13600-like [Vicia villosa]
MTESSFGKNRLIDVYGKCGFLEDACKVFHHMLHRNTFSWNAVLSALTKCGALDAALSLFKCMPELDQCSWNSMVSGFAQRDCFEEALRFFVDMHNEDFVSCYSLDVYMGSALVDMYSKCGVVESAQGAFDDMGVSNVVSWNSLITYYEQNGHAGKALGFFVGLSLMRILWLVWLVLVQAYPQ